MPPIGNSVSVRVVRRARRSSVRARGILPWLGRWLRLLPHPSPTGDVSLLSCHCLAVALAPVLALVRRLSWHSSPAVVWQLSPAVVLAVVQRSSSGLSIGCPAVARRSSGGLPRQLPPGCHPVVWRSSRACTVVVRRLFSFRQGRAGECVFWSVSVRCKAKERHPPQLPFVIQRAILW